jgi:hypothetical protein
MYTYVLIGNVEVYEVLMYDSDADEYYYDEVSIIKSSNRALVYLGEFGTVYQNYADNKLDFDASIAGSLKKPKTEYYEAQREIIALTPNNCADNNGYDRSKPSTDMVARGEIDPHMVDLWLEGCHKLASGKYVIADESAFALGFVFVQGANKGDIALTHISGSGLYSAGINADTWNSNVKDTNISGTVKKGAYFFKVYYKDGSSDTGVYRCDFMNGHIATDVVRIGGIENVNQSKTVDKIVVTCVYEIFGYWKGLFGVTKSTSTNWRCDYTLLFE